MKCFDAFLKKSLKPSISFNAATRDDTSSSVAWQGTIVAGIILNVSAMASRASASSSTFLSTMDFFKSTRALLPSSTDANPFAMHVAKCG